MDNVKKIKTLNRYYKMTKFYAFLKNMAIKGGLGLFVVVALFVVLDYYVLDTEAIFKALVTSYSSEAILFTFFVSETLLGLVPPEIFIAWSAKTSQPWFYLFLIALLSYLGGICSYFIGKLIANIPSVNNYLHTKIANHISNLRKWGGFFVVVGALLPLPHSVVSFACGLINYKFKHYALWALFRFLRFFIYAVAIFNVL